MPKPSTLTRLYRARYLHPISRPPIEDGALAVAAGRLVAVGCHRDLAGRFPAAETVDFGEAVLLPPLVNAHTHLELSHFPRWAADAGEDGPADSFVDWILRMIRVRRTVAEEGWRDSLAAGIEASLRAGTGAVGDILSNLPALAAYRQAPLRGRVFLEVLGREPAGVRDRLRTIGERCRLESSLGVSLGLAPHSPYTLSAETLGLILAAAPELALPLTLHLAESPAEREFLLAGTGDIPARLYPVVGWGEGAAPPAGLSPVAYLDRLGGLGPDCLLVHGVQVGDDDLDLLLRTGAGVVLCPRSNARLGVGRAPAAAYRARGIPLALGTDSLASAPSLSVWDELAFASDWFQPSLPPRELLAIATAGGAAVLGLAGEIGTLEAGSGAHFQVLVPTWLPSLVGLEEFLCAAGRGAEVADLYLAGRSVLPKG